MTDSICTKCWRHHEGIVCQHGASEWGSGEHKLKTPLMASSELSHKARFLQLLHEMGVVPNEHSFWQSVSLEAGAPRVEGYTGSMVDFEFDADGKFKSIYIHAAG